MYFLWCCSCESCINILKISTFPSYSSSFIQTCCKDIKTRTLLFIVSPFCSTHRTHSEPRKIFGCCVVFIIKCIVALCSTHRSHSEPMLAFLKKFSVSHSVSHDSVLLPANRDSVRPARTGIRSPVDSQWLAIPIVKFKRPILVVA